MLSSIHIQNFRCFNDLQVKGFKGINLIGGLNNSGKTALLEALLISFFPSPETISLLRNARNENDSLIKNATDKVWNYFFFNQDKAQAIKLISGFDNNQRTSLELSCTGNIEAVLENISNALGNGNEKITELLSSRFSNAISLNIKGSGGQKNDFNYYLIPDKEISSVSIYGKTPKGFDVPPFLHAARRLMDNRLSSLYSLAKEKKKLNALNDILKVLDDRIIGSEIDAPGGEPVLKLVLNDDQSFPISMFGDAVQKVTELILVALTTSHAVILIDEIENGIHFTKHKEVWKKLFEVVGNNIQIFATSHSAEMIKAFNEVASKTEFEDKAMYYEMSRTEKTNRIVINPMDMEMLNYEIQTNNSFRGE